MLLIMLLLITWNSLDDDDDDDDGIYDGKHWENRKTFIKLEYNNFLKSFYQFLCQKVFFNNFFSFSF